MLKLDSHPSGHHFLNIPGPSPVPPRILRAISFQVIDHRGPEFQALALKVLEDVKGIFKTKQLVNFRIECNLIFFHIKILTNQTMLMQ